MKWILKKYLLKILTGILAIYLTVNTIQAFTNPVEPVKIVQTKEEISSSNYILTEKMIMGKLQSKSQIVSLEQNFNKKDVNVDQSFFGERKTKLTYSGTYKIGLETKDIEIKHIDSSSGTIYIKLGKPSLISLKIPYDKIEFDKTQGFFRMAMSDEEQKVFYKSVEKNVHNELLKDNEQMNQADMFNQEAVENILKLVPEVKSVVFE